VVQPALSAARILLVDDNLDHVRLLERWLARDGYTNIACATSATEALDQFGDARPDLIVLDLHLPHASGFDILKRLEQQDTGWTVPVLVLTGDLTPQVRLSALERGARDFMSKPADRLELLARVRNLVRSRMQLSGAQARAGLLEASLAAQAHALKGASLETARRLAIAAEWRDESLDGHLERVARYSQLLARAAGLDGAEVARMALAAPLHDIGKIALPDSILRKAGPLTDEQRVTMREHTRLGAEILQNSQFPEIRLAETIALSHHERWDGTGYPFGLRGAQIPIAGRICAIGDTFDALMSVRVYKRAWTIQEALAEIRAQAGRQFDPDLAVLFCAHPAAVAAIHAGNGA